MVFYTKLDLDKEIMLYGEKFNLDLDGKTIRECINIIVESCPKLHSDEELIILTKNNLKAIEEEYGFKALRLFYYDTIKQDLLQSFTGEDALQRKYFKLLKHLKEFHNTKIKELELTLDVYRYYTLLEKVFNEEYGELKYYDNRLYSLMKSLHICYYDEQVIESLYDFLFSELSMSGDKYYIKKDLHDVDVLKMLYEHVAEENFDNSVVHGVGLFEDYDGYGNDYFLHDYEESWYDENGVYHCKMWEKPSSIEDYVKIGLPNQDGD